MARYKEENELTKQYWADKEVCEAYAKKVSQRQIEWLIKALERAVGGLEKSSKIFELGSGSGEDACHLRRLGYEVEVSDLSQNYVDLLNNSGFKARRLDALNDQFPQSCDLIIANFLLQHFPSQQLETIITKVFRSLKPGGRFSFTIAGGKGEGLFKKFRRALFLLVQMVRG